MDYVHDVIFNILQLKLSISVMETDGMLSHQRNEMVSTEDTAINLHIRPPDQLKLKVPPKFSNGGGGLMEVLQTNSNSKCQNLAKFSLGGGVNPTN